MKKRKRIRHRYLGERIWSATKIAVLTVVGLNGALAGIKEIAQYKAPGSVVVGTLIITTLVSVAFGIWRAKVVHIPDLGTLGNSPPDQNLRCKICSSSELREANGMATLFYGGDAVQDEIVEQWRLRNSLMYACIVGASNEIESSFGVMPLTDSFMDQFIGGKVKETDITADDILTSSECRSTNRLYISGVVVRDPRSPRGQLRASAMIWAMLMYLKKIYSLRKPRTVYALAVTKEGEKLLKHLEFQLVSRSSQRADNHNLYSLVLNKESAARIEHTTIPDYHLMCRIEFKTNSAFQSKKQSHD